MLRALAHLSQSSIKPIVHHTGVSENQLPSQIPPTTYYVSKAVTTHVKTNEFVTMRQNAISSTNKHRGYQEAGNEMLPSGKEMLHIGHSVVESIGVCYVLRRSRRRVSPASKTLCFISMLLAITTVEAIHSHRAPLSDSSMVLIGHATAAEYRAEQTSSLSAVDMLQWQYLLVYTTKYCNGNVPEQHGTKRNRGVGKQG